MVAILLVSSCTYDSLQCFFSRYLSMFLSTSLSIYVYFVHICFHLSLSLFKCPSLYSSPSLTLLVICLAFSLALPVRLSFYAPLCHFFVSFFLWSTHENLFYFCISIIFMKSPMFVHCVFLYVFPCFCLSVPFSICFSLAFFSLSRSLSLTLPLYFSPSPSLFYLLFFLFFYVFF